MKYELFILIVIMALLFASCRISGKSEALLQEDKKNKLLELEYLSEIREAQKNNDEEAWRFYFEQYMNVPRLDLDEDLKKHPNYFLGGDKIKY